jgi:predicted nucleotidyltransferase
MELIKKTIKLGNSAGVLLPKEFLNSEVKIITQPLNTEKEVLEILSKEKILKNVLGVYLVGSYSRGEQTIESDIDFLVITDNINQRIKKEKCDLILISQELIKEKMKKDIIPILPMILEAKPIINQSFIKEYSETQPTEENLKNYFKETKSAIEIVNEYLKISEKTKKNVPDAVAYSLVLRLRTIYIIECIRKRKKANKKDFLNLIEKISGSLEAYERYLKSKNKNTKEFKLSLNQAKKIYLYHNKKLNEIKKWLKEKKEQEKKD